MKTKKLKTVLTVLALTWFIALFVYLFFLKKSKVSEKKILPNSICYDYSEVVTEYKNVDKFCPHSKGMYLLPRTFPVKGLFLGYIQDKNYGEIIEQLIGVTQKQKNNLKINLLVSREEVEIGRDSLSLLQAEPYSSFVNIFPMPSDETLWAQDYMELAVNLKTGLPVIVDLPYTEREGEIVPSASSLICKTPMIKQEGSFDSNTSSNGDYGGNIEPLPGGVILVGSNMTGPTRQSLESKFYQQELLTIDVDWLETGHVDELFSFLPTEDYKCPYMFLYASPREAIKILNREKSWNRFLPQFDEGSIFLSEEYTRKDYSSCFEYEYIDETSKDCSRLLQANLSYDTLIVESKYKIRSKINEKLNCDVPFYPVPVLFAPAESKVKYGGVEDYARAINANAVNNILINNQLIVSRQKEPAFQALVEETLQKSKVTPTFVKSELVSQLSGGIHCISNSIQWCEPKTTDENQ